MKVPCLKAFISLTDIVNALDFGSSGQGSSHGRGHCVFFFKARHGFTLAIPLCAQKHKWLPAEF